MALSFTDDARNAAVAAGVVTRGSQTAPNASALEVLDVVLTAKTLLCQQVRGMVGEKVWVTNIAPLL